MKSSKSKNKNSSTNTSSDSVKRPGSLKKDSRTDDNSIQKKKKELINKFIKTKYWDLYLDIFLLFGFSISYSIVLYFTNYLTGQIFVVFAIICCVLISIDYHETIKNEINKVLRDIDIMLKK